MMTPVWTFTGKESVATWISDIESYLGDNKVPASDHYSFAFQHLSESVMACVMSLTSPLEEISSRSWSWDWAKLKVALSEIEKQIKEGGLSTEDILDKVAKVATIGVMACIAGPALLTTALGAIGFSAVGTVAGSIAAGLQSAVYGGAVGAGSLFAFCQSLTMGGAGAVAIATGISGAGGVAAAAIKEVASKPPSKSWEDGTEFRPSIKVIHELLKFLSKD